MTDKVKRKRGRPGKYNFSGMEVNEERFVPAKIPLSAQSVASQYGKDNNQRIRTFTVEGGILAIRTR